METQTLNVVFSLFPETESIKETPKRRRTVSTSLYEIFTGELRDRVVLRGGPVHDPQPRVPQNREQLEWLRPAGFD